MTGQRFKSVWDALPPEIRPMTCQSCIHRLDVTLWGCWLVTGCRVGSTQGPEYADRYAPAREVNEAVVSSLVSADRYARACEQQLQKTSQFTVALGSAWIQRQIRAGA